MRRELSIVLPCLVDPFVHRGAHRAVISRGMPSEQARRPAWRTCLVLGFALLTARCGREAGPKAGATAPQPEPPWSVAASQERPAATPPNAAAAPSASVATAPSASAMVVATEPPPRPFALIELAPTQGDLMPLLREHASIARARGLAPYVEFYADWCKPCKVLAAQMDDPLIVEAFKSTYLIKLNFDDWKEKLADTGFTPREIPMFYALDGAGRPTGRKLSGDAWGRATPSSMAKALGPFFRR
jgi:thiol-disulfide isomerase/thioredoxin